MSRSKNWLYELRMSAGTLAAWNVNQRSGLRQLENDMRTHISQVQVAAYTTAEGTQTDGVVLTTLKSTRTPGWLPTSVNSGPRRNRCVVAGVVSTLITRWRSTCRGLRCSTSHLEGAAVNPSSRVEPLDEERRLGPGGAGVLKPRCATSRKGKSRDCAPIPPG